MPLLSLVLRSRFEVNLLASYYCQHSTRMNIKDEILRCLKILKSGGKFASTGSVPFVFPGLDVKAVGELSYPIPPSQVGSLINVAHKAPFGKGTATIVDENVRRAWEIEASDVSFKGPQWDKVLKKIIEKIKLDLGLEDYNIGTHLYKMLIYEEGDFFLTHKDTEKEKGMFGSLVIVLPSKYSGGELLVRFNGEEEVADFSEATDPYAIHFAAFYADCDHEIKPLKSGNRVCLVYNLVQLSNGHAIKATSAKEHVEELAEILKKSQAEEATEPYVILLGHQYTPENFSGDGLKLDDRLKAEVIQRAAKQAGFYSNLCLVTSFITGIPAYDGYEDDDEEAEMDEIIDEWIEIENWLEGENPTAKGLQIQEGDLIALFHLKDDEPIIKESSGYMGNYGPDLMHYYHYGAIVVWSKEANARLFERAKLDGLLKWLDYFNSHPTTCSEQEATAMNSSIVRELSQSSEDSSASLNPIIEWFIGQNNLQFFLSEEAYNSKILLGRISAEQWCKLLDFWPQESTEKIIDAVTEAITIAVAEPLMSALKILVEKGSHTSFVQKQMKNLPRYFSALYQKAGAEDLPVSTSILMDLFWLERTLLPDLKWKEALHATISGFHGRKYLHFLLVPVLLNQESRNDFTEGLLTAAQEYLKNHTSKEPQPPANWTRGVPTSESYQKVWDILRPFLESPTQEFFDFRKNQHERKFMEYAIKSVTIDLRTETIEKGSPYTLRIIKTMQAYHHEMDQWKTDKRLLGRINKELLG
jgi:streptomycin 6-kinase